MWTIPSIYQYQILKKSLKKEWTEAIKNWIRPVAWTLSFSLTMTSVTQQVSANITHGHALCQPCKSSCSVRVALFCFFSSDTSFRFMHKPSMHQNGVLTITPLMSIHRFSIHKRQSLCSWWLLPAVMSNHKQRIASLIECCAARSWQVT